jgi:predicted Zn-dependent protease with MMP-like domain
MTRSAHLPPSLDDFEKLAVRAWNEIPDKIRELCGPVEVFVADFADEETLDAVGAKDAFELTGVYVGIDLTKKSVGDPNAHTDRVVLYRRPILDEWAGYGDVDLGDLVTHVLIHEIGHHFGLTDEDMHAIEAETR